MNIEEKIKICKALKKAELIDGYEVTPLQCRVLKIKGRGGRWFNFDPELNWKSCGLVLEALRHDVDIVEISGNTISLSHYNKEADESKCFYCDERETLQESICRAYLNTIGEEG